MNVRQIAAVPITLVLFVGWTAPTLGETPSTPVRGTRAEVRQQIRATPLMERPNRPLHFYGNTVRRVNGK